jgi:hypothetical protein
VRNGVIWKLWRTAVVRGQNAPRVLPGDGSRSKRQLAVFRESCGWRGGMAVSEGLVVWVTFGAVADIPHSHIGDERYASRY